MTARPGATGQSAGRSAERDTWHRSLDQERVPAHIPFHRSIRWRLTLIIVALVVVTIAALSIADFLFLRGVLNNSLQRQLQLYGQGLSASINAFANLQQERVSLVSSRTRLRQLLVQHADGALSDSDCREQTLPILRDAAASIDSFLSIRIADPNGVVVTASDPSLIGEQLAQHPAFLAGRQRAHLSAPERTDAGLTSILSAPIATSDDRQLGVVLVATDVGPLQHLLAAIVSGYQTVQVRLATRVGDRIRYVLPIPGLTELEVATTSDPAMASALRGEQGFLEDTQFLGRDVVTVHLPSGYEDWGLVVQLDADEAYEPGRMLIVPILLVGAASAMLAMYVGLRLATSFTRPIRKLSTAALAIERGEYEARATVSANDEVGTLAQTFNHMAIAVEGFRTQMQDRVLARTQDLERVGEQLREAKERAEQASNAKTRFLAGMSHEIRTPMNGVLGMTELLLRSDLSEQQRHRMLIVHESGQLLLRLLNDILDLSKVEAGKLSLANRDFSVRDLASGVMQTFEPAAQKKDVELICEVDDNAHDLVRGDADRLRQVLTNLIGNAIKFTQHGSVRLTMTVTPAPHDANRHRLSAEIQDTGIGIPEDQQALVFERFHQIDDADAATQTGTGLGLTISMRLVKLMGGQLQLKSQPGKGSTFSFHLDLAKPKRTRSPKRAPDTGSTATTKCNVLLAEDGEVNQEVARSMLEHRGHRVLLATNGIETLEMLARHDVDVVLMDVQMPEMDGFEATRQIRMKEELSGQRVPIIGLSAHALRGFRNRCLEAGMDDFLTKPISQLELQRAVESWSNGSACDPPPSVHEVIEPDVDSASAPNAPRAAALRRVGGIEATLTAIVRKFSDEAPRLANNIEQALEGNQPRECERAAHTLKGSAELLGCEALRAICLQIEELARQQDLTAIRPMVGELLQETKAAVAVVGSW